MPRCESESKFHACQRALSEARPLTVDRKQRDNTLFFLDVSRHVLALLACSGRHAVYRILINSKRRSSLLFSFFFIHVSTLECVVSINRYARARCVLRPNKSAQSSADNSSQTSCIFLPRERGRLLFISHHVTNHSLITMCHNEINKSLVLLVLLADFPVGPREEFIMCETK